VPEDLPEGEYYPRNHAAKSAQVAAIVDYVARENDAGEREKVTLAGHSRGFVTAVNAASQHPDLVDGVIGFNPVGLFGDDTFPRLAGRFSIETVRPEGTLWKMPKELGRLSRKRIWGNREDSMGDVLDIARSDVRPDTAALQEQGIRVDVVIAANDWGFPWRLYRKGLGIAGENMPAELAVSGIASYYPTERARENPLAGKRAGHQQPLLFPAETARLIHQTIFPDENIEMINQNLSTYSST
jgi:pimeloyl-ACP methyl ester carboxylesterase